LDFLVSLPTAQLQKGAKDSFVFKTVQHIAWWTRRNGPSLLASCYCCKKFLLKTEKLKLFAFPEIVVLVHEILYSEQT